MLRALTVRQAQVATRQQVLMHAHGPLIFAPAAKQVAQREVQLRCVGVVLHGFDEGVNRLVLLLVEQEVQALEIGLGGLVVFNAQLAKVKARGQPAQHESQGQTQQDPGQVKVHAARAVVWFAT